MKIKRRKQRRSRGQRLLRWPVTLAAGTLVIFGAVRLTGYGADMLSARETAWELRDVYHAGPTLGTDAPADAPSHASTDTPRPTATASPGPTPTPAAKLPAASGRARRRYPKKTGTVQPAEVTYGIRRLCRQRKREPEANALGQQRHGSGRGGGDVQ